MAIVQIRVVFDTSHLEDRAKCEDVLECLSVNDCDYEADELSAGYEGPVSEDELEFDRDLFAHKARESH